MGEKVQEYLRPSLDELDLLILNTVGHGFLLEVQPEWTAVRNSVDRQLKLMFREHAMATIVLDLKKLWLKRNYPSH